MVAEPQNEHNWLHKLVGDWTFEAVTESGPDKPSERSRGLETVRSLGALWVVCEAGGEIPGGGQGNSVRTLGFDPN